MKSYRKRGGGGLTDFIPSSLFSRYILYYDNFQQPGKYVPDQTPFGGFDFGLAGDREI